MVWRRIFHHDDEPESGETEQPEQAAEQKQPGALVSPGVPGEPEHKLPAHLVEQLGGRRRRPGEPEDLPRKLASLERRRTGVLYDIEQGELATEDDNPWMQRIGLLSEALETVDRDREAAEQVAPAPYYPVPETPITDLSVEMENDVATVRFTVGDERFVYEEPLDWAERGHQVLRGDLRRTEGEAAAVMPEDVPRDLRAPLLHHLIGAIDGLATVLRDTRLEEEPMPESITLADLARPCPTCGGWTDYRGRCQACARRTARLQELFRERDRLLNERAAEIEEQHRIAERLPLARRRLRDVETEIGTVKQKIAERERNG